MTQEDYAAIQATFPWTSHKRVTGIGGLIQVIDRYGNEVPIFTLTDFLSVITAKLAKTADVASKD
jgi:hypothetical protein